MPRFAGVYVVALAASVLAGGRPALAAGVSGFESFYHAGQAAEWNAAAMAALAASPWFKVPDAARSPEAGANVPALPVPAIAGQAESIKAAGRVIASSLPLDEGACPTRPRAASEDFPACLASRHRARRQQVESLLSVMRDYPPATDPVAAERELATLGLLHFLNRDYPAAHRAAARAYDLGRKGERVATVPAFVAAVGAWHEDVPNGEEAHGRFRYAVTAEPANPLLPLLFVTYLDHLAWRGGETVAELERVRTLTETLADDAHRTTVRRVLLAHGLAQMRTVRNARTLPGAPAGEGGSQPAPGRARKAAGDHAALLATASALAAVQPDLPPAFRQALDEARREQLALDQRAALLERDSVVAKAAEGRQAKAEPVEKTEAPPAADDKSSGESGLFSIFNRVKGLFK